MKKFLITGLAIAMSSGALMAQSGNVYEDDVYISSAEASRRAQQQSEEKGYYQQDNNNQYNNDQYGYGYEDEGYIDYDDDTYTSRFRRFNNVYLGTGYWNPVYSPYWADPFYNNPYYYNSWASPGFSISFGTGPYWYSGWGMSNWCGYGGFSYWNNPYWAYGGYYGGYWNGFYDGYYSNFGRYYTPRNVTYGPRTAYGNNRNSGLGSRQNSTIGIGERGVRSRNGSNYVRRGSEVSGRNNATGMTRSATPIFNNNIRGRSIQNAPKSSDINRSSSRAIRSRTQQSAPTRQIETTRPSRSYEAPSRSYTPSRSFNGSSSRGGSFNSGGSSRSSGGGYRR